MKLEVALAASHERAALENLMQLYIHDFSEYWAGRPEGDLDDHGRFAAYPLDAYWREPRHQPLLMRIAGRLVGFALINDASHTDRPVDWNMAEFFVVRKHRGGGVGGAAAHLIFDRYPGQWETAVARRNVVGLSFWRNVTPRHPRVEALEEVNVSSPRWNGPVMRFYIRAAD